MENIPFSFVHLILYIVLPSMYVTVFSNRIIAGFKEGVYSNTKLADNYILTTTYDVSFQQCLQECRDRRACLSVSYQIRTHYCMLGITETSRSSYSLVKARGFLCGDKAQWIKVVDVQCSQCSIRDVCVRTENKTECVIDGCKPPQSDPGQHILGNIWKVGSKVKRVCELDPCSILISECKPDGAWSNASSAVCDSVLPNMDGHKYHITSSLTGKWWHDDASNNDIVSTKYGQGTSADGFTIFSLVKVNTLPGNKYLIKCDQTGKFITGEGSLGLVCRPLKSMDNFLFSISRSCDGVRLFSEQVQRFVYVSGDTVLTTANHTDRSSIFKLKEVVVLG